MKKFLFLIVICTTASLSQGSAGSSAKYEPRFLIDAPTGGIIPHGTLATDIEFFQQGGVLVSASLGLFDILNLGISYGGVNIVGDGSPERNELPGINFRLRLLNESIVFPAIAFGFDSQGKELYNRTTQRFTVKSPGFYIVGSKNYILLGNLSFHGGINYSLERADGDRDPNIFIGAEKSVGSIVSILAEYNLGWNDSHAKAFGRGRGYLNSSIRLSIGDGFSIGFNLKDILKNQEKVTIGNRTILLEYIQKL
ncbi:MAG: YjbH domain-containing protein [Ignavibacteriales bacterium]|nr:YjbH domain-containing protein [Ignavibacteriales bacterium]